MAIAVPLLLAAAGASTAVALTVGVAFAVTGINDKINKAAEGVFGKDLVMVGNLAGMAYGAFGGGFTPSDGISSANQLAAENLSYGLTAEGVPIMADAAVTAASVAPSVAENLSYGLTAEGVPIMADSVASSATSALQDGALGTKLMGTTNAPTDYSQGARPTGLSGLTNAAPTPAAVLPSTTAATAGVTAPAASPYSFASAPAATANRLPNYVGGPGAASVTEAPGFLAKLQAGAGKVIDSPYMMAGLAQGAASGYSAAQTRAMEQAKLDYQQRVANIGSAGWVQTQ